MLVIKTVANRNAAEFDEEVNTLLREGWELVRRECIIIDHTPILYAELERVIDTPDIDEEISDDMATWIVSRNPKNPYKCSACGYTANEQGGSCPGCGRVMIKNEE